MKCSVCLVNTAATIIDKIPRCNYCHLFYEWNYKDSGYPKYIRGCCYDWVNDELSENEDSFAPYNIHGEWYQINNNFIREFIKYSPKRWAEHKKKVDEFMNVLEENNK